MATQGMAWTARHWAGLALALAAVAAVAYVAWPEDRLLRPDDPELVALGQTVYRQHCAACHGERLQGQPNWRERDASGRLPAPPHDASGHTWHHPDQVLFDITKHGVAKAAGLQGYDSAMPAFEGTLGDREIRAVLSWIKAQWPEAIRSRHDRLNATAPGG